MRTMAPTVAGLLTLAAVSVQAAPLPPAKASPAELRAAPIELVRQGCGWGGHRVHWRDRWGYWQGANASRFGDPAAPPIHYEDRTTARGRSSPRQHQQNDREKRLHAAEAEQQHAAEPSAIRLAV
jgi:hypothetical protein